MSDFVLQFDPGEIESLAARFSYEDDAAPRAAGRQARERGFYMRGEFLTVCRWKTRRSGPLVASNGAAAVEGATREAFGSCDESQRIESLIGLAGVGVPTASALLHFAFPNDYGILDVRALESLGCKSRAQYPVSFWLAYVTACRDLAKRHGVPVRVLDKALRLSEIS